MHSDLENCAGEGCRDLMLLKNTALSGTEHVKAQALRPVGDAQG
jgi:hypothetical protein